MTVQSSTSKYKFGRSSAQLLKTIIPNLTYPTEHRRYLRPRLNNQSAKMLLTPVRDLDRIFESFDMPDMLYVEHEDIMDLNTVVADRKIAPLAGYGPEPRNHLPVNLPFFSKSDSSDACTG